MTVKKLQLSRGKVGCKIESCPNTVAQKFVEGVLTSESGSEGGKRSWNLKMTLGIVCRDCEFLT